MTVSLACVSRFAEAEPLGNKALAIRQRFHGENHNDTAFSHNLVGYILFGMGEYEESLEHHRISTAALESVRLRGGSRALDRAAQLAFNSPCSPLAACMLHTGRRAEAWKTIENTLARGLLDEERERRKEPLSPADDAALKAINAELEAAKKNIDRLLADRRPPTERRKELRDQVEQREKSEQKLTRLAVELIQAKLPADAAIVLWLDGICNEAIHIW
jgi:hypothetical protein